ncbi:MAG: winged helix-turn-helix domain-containing protein [Bacteroidia bacterium]
MKLSIPEARRIILTSQGLYGESALKGKTGTLRTIENLGYVQIDTISVVARAHHHTLWSRSGGYTETYLNELLDTKQIFEYWSHAASYLPMKDYRFSLVRKKLYAKGKKHWSLEVDSKMKKDVLARIQKEGGLQSKDFEHPPKTNGQWYTWKPAKRALEQLFMEGKLMVASRKGFQKIYDLTERVLPPQTDTSMPGEAEYSEYLILRSLQAYGLMNASEISYLQGHTRTGVANKLSKLVRSGVVAEVEIYSGITCFGIRSRLETILSCKEEPASVHILSPFDNLVIQRKRLSQLFGFDYVIECYVPEAKRKFGYFCLPVLDGINFAARFDPKADRETGLFHIKSWYSEKGWKPNPAFAEAFALKLQDYARFSGCDSTVAGKDIPALIRKKL